MLQSIVTSEATSSQRSFSPSSLIHLQRVLNPLRLRLLMEVESRGSISAAATACTLTQPSASLHLRTLEDVVGCRLVDRGARGSRLTPQGQIVAEHGARVLAELGAMGAELQALRAGLETGLSVAVCTAASYLMPDALRAFGELNPEVEVSVRVANSAHVYRMVASGEVDFGICGEYGDGTDMVREHLLDDEVVGVAAPGVVPTVRGFAHPVQFARRTLLVLEPGSSQRTVVDRAFAEFAVAEHVRLRLLDSQEALKRAIRGGSDVAFLSQLTVREEVERGELVSFRVTGRCPIAHPLQSVRAPHEVASQHEQQLCRAVQSAWRLFSSAPMSAAA